MWFLLLLCIRFSKLVSVLQGRFIIPNCSSYIKNKGQQPKTLIENVTAIKILGHKKKLTFIEEMIKVCSRVQIKSTQVNYDYYLVTQINVYMKQ